MLSPKKTSLKYIKTENASILSVSAVSNIQPKYYSPKILPIIKLNQIKMKFVIVFTLFVASTLALPQRQQNPRGQRAVDDSQNAQILKYEVSKTLIN